MSAVLPLLLMTAPGPARAAGLADAVSPHVLSASQDFWRSQPLPDDPTERYLRPLAKSPAPAARPSRDQRQSTAAAGGAARDETHNAVAPDSAAPPPWMIGLLVAGGLIVAGTGGMMVIGRRRRRRVRTPRAAALNVPRGHTQRENRAVSEPEPGAGRRAA